MQNKVVTLYFFLLLLSVNALAQRQLVVCDKTDSTTLEDVVLTLRDAKGNAIVTLMTDSIGACEVSEIQLDDCHTALFRVAGYRTERIDKNRLCDTTYLTPTAQLRDVVVRGRRKLYRILPDQIVYDVDADTTLRGKNSFEAMKNVPTLVVLNRGDISTADGTPIEYRMNGLTNPMLTGRLADVLRKLPARTIKRIELRTTYRNQQELTIVNIVTKGRVEGYVASAGTELDQECCFNYVNGRFKIGRWTAVLNYSIPVWYDPKSTTTTDEYRYDSKDLYHYTVENHSGRTRGNQNSYEGHLNYEVNNNTSLHIYGRYVHPGYRRKIDTQHGTAYDADGNTNLSYDRRQRNDNRNREYWVSTYFESSEGENAEKGYLNVGYKFDGNTYRGKRTATYEVDTLLGHTAPSISRTSTTSQGRPTTASTTIRSKPSTVTSGTVVTNWNSSSRHDTPTTQMPATKRIPTYPPSERYTTGARSTDPR